MQFINSINKIKPHHQHSIATIGNFDGLHLGHQHLIHALKKRAQKDNKALMVITFEPLPFEYFSSENPPSRLTTLREKLFWFNHLAIDYVLCLKFNETLSHLSPKTFIHEMLVKQLKITHLAVGEDFRFGHKRQGNLALLEEQSKQNGFTFEIVKKITKDNRDISSTRIRNALYDDNIELANELLGRSYAFNGRVIHGQKLGRTIGFPTANISLRNLMPPIQGVFAVKVLGLSQKPVLGIANIGKKPTINGIKKILEVHLFDFNRSIYGEHIRVIPLKKIRDEKKFSNLSELSSQIAKDVLIAKEFLLPYGCFFP